MPFSLKSLFKKSSKKKVHVNFLSFEPLDDWKRITYFFLVLFGLSILWSGYLFWTIASGKAFEQSSGTASSSPVTLNIKALRAVSEAYYERSDKLDSLLQAEPKVVDPAR